MASNKNRKLVVVGDGMCGKTCLLMALRNEEFSSEHEATVFDTMVTSIAVKKRTVDMALFDTAGQEDYERLRVLSYPGADIVLLCFSVDNPTSIANIVNVWVPEIREYCGLCPVILVACKKDLREDPKTISDLAQKGEKPVTTEIGRQTASEMKADGYMECSAKTGEGVQDLFVEAARLSLKKRTFKLLIARCTLG